MSEAELHVLRARLRGGILNKASRAALKLPLPIGLAYAEDETVILDPDAQIQQAVGLLFATFKRTGPHKGEIHWGALLHSTTRHPSCAILATQEHSADGAYAHDETA